MQNFEKPALMRRLEAQRERAERLGARLTPRPLEREITARGDRLAELSRRMDEAQAARLEAQRTRLEALDRLRETLGYRETLRRGYAVVRSGSEVITTRARAEVAGALEIEFADGTMKLEGERRKPATPKPPAPEQGSLF